MERGIDTFSELMERRIEKDGSEVAISFHDKDVTYQDLGENVDALACGLKKIGVTKGDHVGILLPNCLEFIYCTLALWRLRAVVVPIHLRMPQQQILRVLDASDSAILVTTPDHAVSISKERKGLPKLRTVISAVECADADHSLTELYSESKEGLPVRKPEPEDPTLFLFTSGTTGIPKGALLSQKNLLAGTRAIRDLAEVEERGSWLYVAPLSTSALIPYLGMAALGSSMILIDDFSPQTVLSTLEHRKVRSFFAPSSFYEPLLSFPQIDRYSLDLVHFVATGMDFLSPDLLKRIRERFRGATVINGYGLIETSTIIMEWKSWRDSPAPVAEQMPIPGPGNEVDVMDENGRIVGESEQGEIVVRGPSVIKEYYKNPDATEKAFHKQGWFYTGDIGLKTGEGRIRLIGRRKEVIKRAGRSISGIEIEHFLSLHEKIARATVIGVPHPAFGEMIWAFVEPEQGKALTKGEVMAYCRGKIAPYKVPDQISILSRIPVLPVGNKADKKRLLDLAKKELDKLLRS